MKLPVILGAVAAAAASMSVPAAAPAQGVAVTIGDPGPGWYRWHARRYDRVWDGPRWYNRHGPHYGQYYWNNAYYSNCAWRWAPHRHQRVWRCW